MAQIILVMPLANRFDKIAMRIPNGILAVAALPSRAGYSVKIIDLKIDNGWQSTLASSINSDTICVGISCSTGRMILSALEVASAVRKISQTVPIIWGGTHPTLLPEQTLENPLVDMVVINEGDEVFMELVEALANRKNLSEINGIGYKKSGHVKINPPAQMIKNLDSLPAVPYHLIDVSKYSSLNFRNLASIDLVTSRGCPCSCTFCSTPFTSRGVWRALSVESVIKNISSLKDRYGIKVFYFVDDNFMVDLQRVEQFLDALREAKLKIYWGTQGVRVDAIKKISSRLLDRIEEQGCVELSIGLESANQKILDMVDKRISLQDIDGVNDKLAGRSFNVKYNMMIGFPGETISSIKDTVRLALRLYKKNKNSWFPFNIFTPFPGTAMFQKAIDYGFNVPDKLEEWVHLELVGWGKYYSYWLNGKDSEFLSSINCTSYLAFPSARSKITNPFFKMLFRIYRPFAYFRFSRMFYFMHIEKYLMQFMDNLQRNQNSPSKN